MVIYMYMKSTGKRSLEGYKIFPFMAWALIGVFALFVYTLASDVSEVTEKLKSSQFQKFDGAQVETDLEQ